MHLCVVINAWKQHKSENTADIFQLEAIKVLSTWGTFNPLFSELASANSCCFAPVPVSGTFPGKTSQFISSLNISFFKLGTKEPASWIKTQPWSPRIHLARASLDMVSLRIGPLVRRLGTFLKFLKWMYILEKIDLVENFHTHHITRVPTLIAESYRARGCDETEKIPLRQYTVTTQIEMCFPAFSNTYDICTRRRLNNCRHSSFKLPLGSSRKYNFDGATWNCLNSQPYLLTNRFNNPVITVVMCTISSWYWRLTIQCERDSVFNHSNKFPADWFLGFRIQPRLSTRALVTADPHISLWWKRSNNPFLHNEGKQQKLHTDQSCADMGLH